MRKIFQVLHDARDALEPVQRLDEQVGDVFAQELDINVRLDLVYLLRRRPREGALSLLVDRQQPEHVGDIALQGAQIGVDKPYRIVDFMRYPGRQLADGRHALRLQQLVLRLFQSLDQNGLALLFLLQGLIEGIQVGRSGSHSLFQQVARFTQCGFGQRALGDVLKTKHAANNLLTQVLRTRADLEHATVLVVQQVFGLTLVHDSTQSSVKQLRLDHTPGHKTENARIVMRVEQIVRNLPHLAKQAVHALDLPLPANYQDAIAGRLQRGT